MSQNVYSGMIGMNSLAQLAKLAYDATRLQTKLYELAQLFNGDTDVDEYNYMCSAADSVSIVLSNIHEVLNIVKIKKGG